MVVASSENDILQFSMRCLQVIASTFYSNCDLIEQFPSSDLLLWIAPEPFK
jgi:hypothetical protein